MKSKPLFFMLGIFTVFLLGCDCDKEPLLIDAGDAKPDQIGDPKEEEEEEEKEASPICIDPETGKPGECNDNIFCTYDRCNEETQKCEFIPDNNLCDDGLFCTDNICQPESKECKEKGGFYCCKITPKKCTKPSDAPDCVKSVCVEEEKTCKQLLGKCLEGQYCHPKQGCIPLPSGTECGPQKRCQEIPCFEVKCVNKKCEYTPKKCPAEEMPPCVQIFCDPQDGQCKYIPDHSKCPDDGENCTVERCDLLEKKCVSEPLDLDKDGDPDERCGGSDCDDFDPEINTKAKEICDGKDNDCDGITDEGMNSPQDETGSITIHPGDSTWSSVTWNKENSEYAVVYQDSRGGDEDYPGIYFVRLNKEAQIIPESEIPVSTETYGFHPVIISVKNQYALAYHALGRIIFKRLNKWGMLIPNTQINIDYVYASYDDCKNSYRPALIYISDLESPKYAVAFTHYAHDDSSCYNPSYRHWAIVLYILSSSGETVSKSMASDLTSFTPHNQPKDYPSLAWSGNELGIVWQDNRSGDYEIYYSCMTLEGERCEGAREDKRISADGEGPASNDQLHPQIVWMEGERTFGIVWIDYRSNNWEIYFSSIRPNGTVVVDNQQVTYTGLPGYTEQHAYPSLVWTGDDFALSWQGVDSLGNQEIFFARMDKEGILEKKEGSDEPNIINVSRLFGQSYQPDLIWHAEEERPGGVFGVAWHDNNSGPNSTADYEVWFKRILCLEE